MAAKLQRNEETLLRGKMDQVRPSTLQLGLACTSSFSTDIICRPVPALTTVIGYDRLGLGVPE